MPIQNTNLYTVGNKKITIPFVKINTQDVPYLNPKGGVIDIWKNFPWSNNGDVSEVPWIYVKELELDYGTWTTNIARLFQTSKDAWNGDKLDAYQIIYSATETGFSYAFPWLLNDGSQIRNVKNSWDQAQGVTDLLSKLNTGNSALENLGKLFGAGAALELGTQTAGVGVEPIYQYTGTNPSSITIKFPLYNTIDTKSAFDNYAFVSLFTFQNLKNRTSFLTYIPPKIYTLDSYAFGGIYWPAAYVSDLTIDSIGTTRYLSDYKTSTGGNQLLVPEAYKVSITFTELLPQSSNIFAGTMGGTKVTVAGADYIAQAFQNNAPNAQKQAAITKSTGGVNALYPTQTIS